MELYNNLKEPIIKKIQEFKYTWEHGDDKRIFSELAFCLLTPQSRAKTCWNATKKLIQSNLLFTGDVEAIQKGLHGVRFKHKKALYIVRAREFFSTNSKIKVKAIISQFQNVFDAREWLVRNINGFGYKEASHFLRNIGKGENISILDRHILKNLLHEGVIKEIPSSLTKKRYIQVEDSMRRYADSIGIPLHHLDFVFWYKETGEIFK